jgi:hypothetical protein
VTTSTPHEESVAAVFAALNPYAWRNFTPELVARRVVAACDRQDLIDLLRSVPGAVVGGWEDQPEPADPKDPRVLTLVEFLERHRWTRLRLDILCRLLLAVLRGAS